MEQKDLSLESLKWFPAEILDFIFKTQVCSSSDKKKTVTHPMAKQPKHRIFNKKKFTSKILDKLFKLI